MKTNYYTIHKNKSVKRLRKKNNKYFSLLVPRLSILQAISSFQSSIIASQPIINKTDKKLKIYELIIDNAKEVSNIFKQEKADRFKKTGRYIK